MRVRIDWDEFEWDSSEEGMENSWKEVEEEIHLSRSRMDWW